MRKNTVEWNSLNNIDIPMKVMYPHLSDTFPLLSRIKLKNRYKNLKILKIQNYTHLFPMETPNSIAKEILNF